MSSEANPNVCQDAEHESTPMALLAIISTQRQIGHTYELLFAKDTTNLLTVVVQRQE